MNAYNKEVDQPAHPRSLISAFVIRYLENTTSPMQNFNTLASLAAEQADFGVTVKPVLTRPHKNRQNNGLNGKW